MRLPNTYSLNRGFSFMELIVVMGIFAAIMALGLMMSMESYRGVTFRSDRDIAVSLLQKARSHAMSNLRESPWGVCFVDPDYILFRGTTCSIGTYSEVVRGNPSVTRTGFGTIVFSQLAGTTTPATITLTQNSRTSNISINYEGTINW